MLTLVVLEGVVVAILAFLVLGLLKSHAEILRRLHELGVPVEESSHRHEALPDVAVSLGDRPRVAEDVVGETPDGEAVAISVTGAPHRSLLAFLSSGCATCADFWRVFARPETLALPADTRVVVVTRGPELESVTAIREVAPAATTVVMSTETWERYAVPGSPYFVLVDGATGAVAGAGTGTSWTQVQSLMDQALADRTALYDRGDRGGRGPRLDRGRDRDGGDQTLRRRRTDRDRMDTDDAELLAAGIGPGHPSLFPDEKDSPPSPPPPPMSRATRP